MKPIYLECPEGKYISRLKNFGFLQKMDKRIREKSHGYILCHEAMHQEDLPLSTKAAETTLAISKYEEEIRDAYYELK